MPTKRDYYEVLGVSRNATQEDIKRAYRRLAKQYHPDINKSPDAQKKFEEIQEANDVLSDEKKKRQYDQFGHAAFDPNAGFGGGGGNPFGSDFGDIFEDIFSQAFGGGASRSSHANYVRPEKGADTKKIIEISFMDAIKGKQVKIKIPTEEHCQHCNGTGSLSRTRVTCNVCGGRGRVRQQQRTIFGISTVETACPNCHGKGQVVKDRCPHCNASGYRNVEKEIVFSIPAGISNGQSLKIPGKGHHGHNGGPYGDLYVVVRVRPDKDFERKGNDIYLSITLSVVDVMLGCKIYIPTIYGQEKISIPAGTQPNAILKLQGRGIKTKMSTGDQYIKLNCILPTRLTEKQRELLEKVLVIEQSKAEYKKNFDRYKRPSLGN